jgi:lipopolysaccharide/colanic/teichoic acid biosynthesis glycosyltransferase
MSAKHILFLRTSSMSFIFLRGHILQLRAAGYEVTCVSAPGAWQHIAHEEGAHVIEVPLERQPNVLSDIGNLWRLWKIFRAIQPDLIHIGTPKAGLLGNIAAKLSGAPARIYCLMGLRFETLTGWKRRIVIGLEKTACALADSVVCVSRSLREQALTSGVGSIGKLVVLGEGSSNGVDLERFSTASALSIEAQALRKQFQIGDHEFVIGFVGRLVRDKGVPELVEAFERVRRERPARLISVGAFEDGDPLSEELIRTILKNEAIRLIPFVENPAPIYHMMDVLVLPTHREGFPNVVLEAQACGKPVITTDATGAIDSIIDGTTGLMIPVGDPARLTNALLKIAADPDRAAAMGKAGRERVQKQFDQKVVWDNLLSHYEQVMRSATRQRGAGALVKWCFDRIFGFVLFAAMSPLLLVTALIVLFSLGWPVIFRQQRLGRSGKPIFIHKFRTMSQARDVSGKLLPDHKRATRVGRVMRALSLDELPQLWDVLRGAMSFVGPRPLLVEYKERYSTEQFRRHNVFPGITGWAQINGRNTISWEDKFRFDVWYVDHWSLWLDLKILAKTFARVIQRRDIAQQGYEGAEEFLGSDHSQ